MKRLGIRAFQKKPTQFSAQVSLAASATIPDSGLPFLNNSQGASAVLSKFTGDLSAALAHIDLDDNSEEGPFKSQLRLLEDAVMSYSNSCTPSNLEEWKGSKAIAEIVTVAFKCAASVYKSLPKAAKDQDSDGHIVAQTSTHRKPSADGYAFKEIGFAQPSIGGTAKAIGFWNVEPETTTSEGSRLPALLIAVRGTERLIDHMVNTNGAPVPALEFLGTKNHRILHAQQTGVYAHSGFLNSAKALLSLVQQQISSASQEGRIKHIVFTGHSAGGAVASLLYQKFFLEATTSYPNLTFSCITFGSPPTLTVDITAELRLSPSFQANRGLNLAFVNEFDMVPRADQSFVRSLIDLYRFSYGLEPIMHSTIALQDKESNKLVTEEYNSYYLPPLSFQQSDSDMECGESSIEKQWKLPLANFHIIGELVLLRKEKAAFAGPGKRVTKILRALSISREEYEKLLFCGVETHSRTYYDDRVELMLQGNFNYRNGWNC